MSNTVRVIVVILCVVALYYLVINLSRNVREEDGGIGWLGGTQESYHALNWENSVGSAERVG